MNLQLKYTATLPATHNAAACIKMHCEIKKLLFLYCLLIFFSRFPRSMEKNSVFNKAFTHISNEELEQGLKIISEHLLRDCIMLMASLTREQNKYELYSLFYENYLDLAAKVKSGSFSFVSDAAFKSFFKTGCSHRAKEYNRSVNRPKEWLTDNFFSEQEDALDEAFEECKTEEYSRISAQYGIDLNTVEQEDDMPAMVISAFHNLNEKCKFLVVMKYMLSLSHKDIVDCLSNFYELKNENVSKTELKRCLDNLKKQSFSNSN